MYYKFHNCYYTVQLSILSWSTAPSSYIPYSILEQGLQKVKSNSDKKQQSDSQTGDTVMSFFNTIFGI